MHGSALNPSLDIIDTALGESSFHTFIGALQTAGLVDTLKSAGPFTVFAPTDEAFDKLAPGAIQVLEKPANLSKLKAILNRHIVGGRHNARDLSTRQSLETLSGSVLTVVTDAVGTRLDGAKVIGSDIPCTNGVIHVIDTVIELKA